jgi:hypothetical protein
VLVSLLVLLAAGVTAALVVAGAALVVFTAVGTPLGSWVAWRMLYGHAARKGETSWRSGVFTQVLDRAVVQVGGEADPLAVGDTQGPLQQPGPVPVVPSDPRSQRDRDRNLDQQRDQHQRQDRCQQPLREAGRPGRSRS